MTDHPKTETLEQLQQKKLRGGELLEVLRHLEDCDQCFLNLPPQDPAEVLNRIFKPDAAETDEVINENDKYEN